jgi:hypothetical protein
MVPERLSDRVIRMAQRDRKDGDTFPAVYRLNTAKAFAQQFPRLRYDHYVIPWDAEPAYHFGSELLYALALGVQYVTPAYFKTVLMVFMRKRNPA